PLLGYAVLNGTKYIIDASAMDPILVGKIWSDRTCATRLMAWRTFLDESNLGFRQTLDIADAHYGVFVDHLSHFGQIGGLSLLGGYEFSLVLLCRRRTRA